MGAVGICIVAAVSGLVGIIVGAVLVVMIAIIMAKRK